MTPTTRWRLYTVIGLHKGVNVYRIMGATGRGFYSENAEPQP